MHFFHLTFQRDKKSVRVSTVKAKEKFSERQKIRDCFKSKREKQMRAQ